MKKRGIVVLLAVMILVSALICQRHSIRRRNATPPARHTSAAPQSPPVQELPTEWNTYHGDAALRGVAETALPEQLAELWRFKAGAPVRQTPVVHDNRIFFATARGEVFAIDLNGQRLWSKELFTGEMQKDVPARERIEAPLVCVDDLVLVGVSRGVLYAFDAVSGAEKWHTQLDGPVLGSPNFLRATPNGEVTRVYVIDKANAVLQCLDPKSGNILWRSKEIERCDGSPAVSPEAVVFGSCAAALHILAPDTGAVVRNIEAGEDSQIAGGVALDGDRAFSGSRSGAILQVDIKTGDVVWRNTDSKAEVFSTPAITSEYVVAASDDGNVLALDRPSGTLRWKFDTKGMPGSPVIAGNKVAISADGELFLLDLANGLKLSSIKVSDEITSPAVAARMILVGSEDGTVAALGAPREGAATP